MNYSILEIASILGVKSDGLTNCSIDTLLTDSRSLTYPETSLFFAIRTSSNDGHKYVNQLYNNGVRNFVVEEMPQGQYSNSTNFIVVENTTTALQDLAAYHRKRFNIPVIAITGSRGKTIVKEWLYQILRDKFNIVRSPRSYNSQIGVPLSLWDIDDNTEMAIIEAGISKPDEMHSLAKMICPTATVITNIGDEHKEGFTSIEEKCVEKLRLSKGSDYIIYNSDDSVIVNGLIDLSFGTQEICWSKSISDAPLFISSIIRHIKTSDINFTYLFFAEKITIPFTEDADIENAITCLATLLAMRILFNDDIREKFANLSPTGSRIDVIEGVNNC